MARTQVNAKLLNSDGSLQRERVGPREMSTLMASGRVTMSRHRNGVTLRLKDVPRDSTSDASLCMPTVGESKAYAEMRMHPADSELVAKVEGCRVLFRCVVMDLRGMTAELLTDGVAADAREAEMFA